jgi:outer membrane receptor protein involved in Fe transport
MALTALAALGAPPPATAQPTQSLRLDTSQRPIAASPEGRQITLDLQGVRLDSALDAIARQAAVTLTYSATTVPVARRVTVRVTRASVDAAFRVALEGTGFRVLWLSSNQAAVVRESTRTKAQLGAVVGVVTDHKTGSPIAAATVTLDGTRFVAHTGDDGRYRLSDVPAGTYTLTVRRLSYRQITQPVTVLAEQATTVDITLEPSPTALDQVVVTGTIVPTQVKAIPTPVSIISDSDIARQHIYGVQDLVRQSVPGAVSWDVAPYPVQNSFSVRGASRLGSGGAQMKVFVDGIETALQWGTIDPRSVERIEVIRGPQAASIYGSDAIDGVVQIFTKRGNGDTRPHVDVETQLGDVQTPYAGFRHVLRQQYSAAVRGGTPDLGYNIGGSYTHTGDYLPNGEPSTQENRSVYGGVRYSHGSVSFDISGRHYDWLVPQVENPPLLETGVAVFSKPFYKPQDERSETMGARLTITHATWLTSVLTLGTDRFSVSAVQTQPRLTVPADTELAIVDLTTQRTSVGINTSLQGTLISSVTGSLTLGVDHYDYLTSSWSTNGALVTFGNIVTDAAYPVAATRTVSHNTGEYVQGQLGFAETLFLTAGIRAEHNSAFGDSLGTPLSPRVGLSYVRQLGRATLKVRSSYGTAIRVPDPTLKLRADRVGTLYLASPNLGPERQHGGDVGVDVVFGRGGSLGITYYNQIAKDLIAAVPVASSEAPSTYRYENVGQVHNTGVELEGSAVIGPAYIKAQYGYASARVGDLGPGYTGDQRIGDQVFITPKHKAGVTAVLSLFNRLTLAGGLTYVGSWLNYDYLAEFGCLGGTRACPPEFTATGSTRAFLMSYPSFVKVRLSASSAVSPRLSVFIKADNLTDTRAYEIDNFEFPIFGRVTSVGLQFHY